MEVVVEDKQLSLAIGKKGQNVRLAAKLTGWRIDIKSEEEKRREVEAEFGALEAGDPQAQMDALFPDTPAEQPSADESAAVDVSAVAEESEAEAEAAEPIGETAEAEAAKVEES